MQVSFTLPIPPSSNNQYASVNGRLIKSKEMRLWWKEAGLRLNRQRQQRAGEIADLRNVLRLRVDCCFYFPTDRVYAKDPTKKGLKGGGIKKIDTMNRVKPLHDLVADGLDIDDSRFWAGYCEKACAESSAEPWALITLRPYDAKESPFRA